MTEAFFVGCTPGLEQALEAELKDLGVNAHVTTGGCEGSGPDGSMVRVNVQSRLASRLLLRVGRVGQPGELRRLPIASLLARGPFSLSVQVEKGATPKVTPEVWRNEAVKAWGASSEGGVEVSFRLDRASCLVSVDTSGDLLHVRGWRQETGKAPLRETLAAGLLRLSGWAPGEALWDVMCGSGTVIIEAAERAQGLQPGRLRSFAFERFGGHDAGALVRAKQPAPAIATWLRGSDVNAGALGVARRNARRAGVVDTLKLERLDATQLTAPGPGSGMVIANLPYGKRVGNRFDLSELYRAVGKSLARAVPGWRLGLPIDARVTVQNGGLPCVVVTGRVPA